MELYDLQQAKNHLDQNQLLGYKQSGVPTLRFANLNRDLVILENARNDANSLIEKNDARINEHMKRWLRNFEEIVTV